MGIENLKGISRRAFVCVVGTALISPVLYGQAAKASSDDRPLLGPLTATGAIKGVGRDKKGRNLTIWIPKNSDNSKTMTSGGHTHSFIFPDKNGKFFVPQGSVLMDAENTRYVLPKKAEFIAPSHLPGHPDLIHLLPEIDQCNSKLNQDLRKSRRPGVIFLDVESLATDKIKKVYRSPAHIARYDDPEHLRQPNGQPRQAILDCLKNRDIPMDVTFTDGKTGSNTAKMLIELMAGHIKNAHGVLPYMYDKSFGVLTMIYAAKSSPRDVITKGEFEATYEILLSQTKERAKKTGEKGAVAYGTVVSEIRRKNEAALKAQRDASLQPR